MSNVVYLHGQPEPIIRFLRVSEHRRLEHLLAADRLPYNRFVIEAGAFQTQIDLVNALRKKKLELVLDTNVAELSAIARFSGQAKHSPWANPDGILTEVHLIAGANAEIISAIARFAVSHGFARVLSPSHFITGTSDGWFEIDLNNCVALRRALDVEGGKSIMIDYPLIIPKNVLDDASQRRGLIKKLALVPTDGIWMRISGFGADATAAGLRKYIADVQDFHALGKPLIADGVGGLSALAILAFGATCGISHGVASKERFDASCWYKPPKADGGGGGGNYNVLLAGIDRLLRREDAEAIVNASGGRRLVSCADRACCPLGFEDTINDPKKHFLRQRALRCDTLEVVPEPLRTKHFLDKDLTEADRRARLIAKLKLEDKKLSARLVADAIRLDRMRDVLGNLELTSRQATRSPRFPIAISKNSSKSDRS